MIMVMGNRMDGKSKFEIDDLLLMEWELNTRIQMGGCLLNVL